MIWLSQILWHDLWLLLTKLLCIPKLLNRIGLETFLLLMLRLHRRLWHLLLHRLPWILIVRKSTLILVLISLILELVTRRVLGWVLLRRIVKPLPLLLRILVLRLRLLRRILHRSLWLVRYSLIGSTALHSLLGSRDLLPVYRPLSVPVFIVDLNHCFKVYKIILINFDSIVLFLLAIFEPILVTRLKRNSLVILIWPPLIFSWSERILPSIPTSLYLWLLCP